MFEAAAAGFLTGLSLIMAIGAQNAFVLRQGLRREHVGAVVAVCAGSDALLIAAGVAGFYEVAGPLGQLSAVISPGYGFTAIIVAFVGRLHPAGILLGGLFLALTYVGGEAVQVSFGIPAHITRVFQGLLLFFLLASEFFTSWRITRSGA